MGPNGTGKSTLAYAIMGHPRYQIAGDILLDGESIRPFSGRAFAARDGFLLFNTRWRFLGVTLANFLRVAINASRKADDPEDKGISIVKFRQMLKARWSCSRWICFAGRYLNEGFFLEVRKKRAEILQMAMLRAALRHLG